MTARRVPARSLPPAVRAALAAYVRRASRRTVRDVADSREEREIEAAIVRFGAGQAVVGTLLAFGGVMSALALFQGEPLSSLAVGPLVAGFGLGGVAAMVNPYRSSPSASFLTAVLPHLAISVGDRRVVEALLAGADETVVARLNEFAAAEARLDDLTRRLGEDPTPALRRERDDLRARAEATRDPEAREAFAASLAFVESRLAAAESARPLRERLAAHRALLDGAARSLAGEAAATSGETITMDAAPLLARIGDLADEVVAREAAVREMRAL